ncbi:MULTISPECIES: hypothetical protein [Hymenobacter]|uniref:MoxR-vWA-beta-propeller ternary system domain-containing protein n=1 Tax=Hymenobacter mucosus TaxID=1411120 RepID=A0A238ZG14_9BACT|nr:MULTISPECIES: hypothetical protein [Hymenobacter]SNR82445.1 hypothetical protein SAMN06269173_10823 [Hymenobacter mucosus]
MQLTLHYQATASHAPCAAFLRGTAPAEWLREISRWNVPLAELVCFLVPESIRSVKAAGLFVALRNSTSTALAAADLLEPYGVVAGRLYVPVQAALWPETTPAELAQLLLWERQLFHPTIGVVGFEATDELHLADLLDCGTSLDADWTWAHPGLPARPPLQQLQVQQPTATEVVGSFREDVGTEPLTSLPQNTPEERTPLQKTLDEVKRRALEASLAGVKGVGQALTGLGSLLPSAGGGPGDTASAGPGLLDRFENWLASNLSGLDQKRNDEIQRLLQLFDENMEEALKYAIPLDGPYLNRGVASPSTALQRHGTNFDPTRLGGGSRVDGWNLGLHEYQLRANYQRAATQEAEAGNYKKAAYIYAHLLGDYHSAARVLEQGVYYREAAILYKDHLKDLPAAAECLERGNLLLEAVEVYEQLRRPEKAGDLYQQLRQPARAAQRYEQAATIFRDNGDYLETARVLEQKLADPARAQEVLLQGWNGAKQAEACLLRYFEVVANQPEAALAPAVQQVYQDHTPPQKRPALLQVLVAVQGKQERGLQDVSREIAYEIISGEASAGQLGNVHLLKQFLPQDQLLGADLSRYVTGERARMAARPTTRPETSPAATSWQLDPEIQWLQAVAHRNQFVAIGTRENRLHLVRGNWYGNFEYYSWPNELAADSHIQLLADAQHGTRILLRDYPSMLFETKLLPKNKYFSEALTIESPVWLPKGPLAIALLPEREIATLTISGGTMMLRRYSGTGALLNKVDYFPAGDMPAYAWETPGGTAFTMVYRNGTYYTFAGEVRLELQETGEPRIAGTSATIGQMAVSAYAEEMTLAFGTEHGSFLCGPLQPGRTGGQQEAYVSANAPTAIQFVGPNKLAVASVQQVVLYAYSKDDEDGTPEASFATEAPIIAILPTSNREQFALLLSTGEICLKHQEPTS